jgi:hypothetical protein
MAMKLPADFLTAPAMAELQSLQASESRLYATAEAFRAMRFEGMGGNFLLVYPPSFVSFICLCIALKGGGFTKVQNAIRISCR